MNKSENGYWAKVNLSENGYLAMYPGSSSHTAIQHNLKKLPKQPNNWLPVSYRIVFKHLLFVYKSLNGLCPQYLRNLLEHRKSARSLRSNFQGLLIQPTCKTKTYGDRAFSVCGPKIWNTVPLEIRQSSTVVLFKKKLKTFLFTRFIESNSLSYF